MLSVCQGVGCEEFLAIRRLHYRARGDEVRRGSSVDAVAGVHIERSCDLESPADLYRRP